MPNPPAKTAPYPTIEAVLNLVRALLNDTQAGATGTPGEGRVFVDSAPFILPLLNNAMGRLQRDLETRSVPRPILSTIITGIPPINSSLGAGVGNPAAFQNISYTGFFDGLLSYGTPTLPPDMLVPKKLEQRPTNSGQVFIEAAPAQDGIPSAFQDFSLGAWQYEDDRIVWSGSLVQMDIRLRYTSSTQFYTTLQPSAFPTTQLAWRDCVDAIANHIAWNFNESRLPGSGAKFELDYNKQMGEMVARYIRVLQATGYSREPFGQDGDLFGWL